MPDLSQVQRETAALNRRLTRDAIARSPSPASVQTNLGLALAIGDRVLDLISGEQGVIVDATVEHVIVSASGQ
jgi:hypothetical protein